MLKDISYLKQYFNVTHLNMLMVNFIIFTRMCLFSYTQKVAWDLRQIMKGMNDKQNMTDGKTEEWTSERL